MPPGAHQQHGARRAPHLLLRLGLCACPASLSGSGEVEALVLSAPMSTTAAGPG